MDRRVAALFGGIVAVGIGPAVWLGGTLLLPASGPGAPTPGGTAAVSVSPSDLPSPVVPSADPSASVLTPLPRDGDRYPGRPFPPSGSAAPSTPGGAPPGTTGAPNTTPSGPPPPTPDTTPQSPTSPPEPPVTPPPIEP